MTGNRLIPRTAAQVAVRKEKSRSLSLQIGFLALVILLFSPAALQAGGGKEDDPGPISADTVSSASFDTMSVAWKFSGDEVIITLAAKTTGWISIGFNPSQVMKDADYMIGYVASDGTAFLRDDYGSGLFAHAPDTSAGGSDDKRLISSREENGWTEIVFAMPRDSGDRRDTVLASGKRHKILLAHGPNGSDDFRTKHSFRTSFEVDF